MGVARVNGVLAVARAFGNRMLRDVIRPDAEVIQKTLRPEDHFLLLASDGLFDVVSNAEVCQMCYKLANQGVQIISEYITKLALQRGSMVHFFYDLFFDFF